MNNGWERGDSFAPLPPIAFVIPCLVFACFMV